MAVRRGQAAVDGQQAVLGVERGDARGIPAAQAAL
jgi:hypothetical protein